MKLLNEKDNIREQENNYYDLVEGLLDYLFIIICALDLPFGLFEMYVLVVNLCFYVKHSLVINQV